MDFHELLDVVFYKDDKNTGERKPSCCKLLIVVVVILMILGMVTSIITHSSSNDIDVNVPNDFRINKSSHDLCFDNEYNNVSIQISKATDGCSDGYVPYNGTSTTLNRQNGSVLWFVHVTDVEGDDPIGMYYLGEYVLIDDEKYWVDVGFISQTPDAEYVNDVMNYLNSHNDWEFVSS